MRAKTGRPDGRRLTSAGVLALSLTGLLLAPGIRAGPQSTDRKPPITAEARDRVRQAVAAVGLVLVRRQDDPRTDGLRPRGSAVIVRKDGVLATSYHVIVEDGTDHVYDEIYFSLPATAATAAEPAAPLRLQVVLVDRVFDLALLRIVPDKADATSANTGDFPAIGIGDSRGARLLDDLIIIGFPEKGGATVTVNTGLIEGTDPLENWIKTDARLIHGNSGGAAVNGEGKLIGIPTKVVADRQPVDKDGDGFPDDYKWLGAVGFLRPAYLVDSMLAELVALEAKESTAAAAKPVDPATSAVESTKAEPLPPVVVRGVVNSAVDGKPIAGARVGLTLLGSLEVTASNLLTWGGTNAEGQFELNKSVPPGRYTLKAKAIKHEACSLDVEVGEKMAPLVINLRPSP